MYLIKIHGLYVYKHTESNHKDHRGDDGIEPCFQHSPKMCFDLRVNIPFINCGTDCIETIPHPLQGYVTDHLHHCSIFCGSRGNPTLTTRLNVFTIFKIANLCPLGTSICGDIRNRTVANIMVLHTIALPTELYLHIVDMDGFEPMCNQLTLNHLSIG